MKKNTTTNILVINFGGLGDQVLFFPTLKTIKSEFSSANLTLVTEPRSSAADKLTDLIDKTILCDIKNKNKYISLLKFLLKIQFQKYDMVISSGSSQFVAILLFLTGIKTKIGYDSGKLSRFLLSKAVPINNNLYAADMYHSLAKALNDSSSPSIPEVIVKPELQDKFRDLITDSNKKTIVIHPGVSKLSIQKNFLKFWHENKWTELILKLLESNQYKIVLAGGPDDQEISAAITEKLEQNNSPTNNFINLVNKTKNIEELSAIIKLADLLICVDSAPMHIGVGTNTPTIAIFGPTDEKKLLPCNNENFIAITKDNLECRPCLWDKRTHSCEELFCLDIEVEKVLEAVLLKTK